MSGTDGAGGTDGAAGAGGAPNDPPFNGSYIGPDGDDAATGTMDAPFETLAHAASVARAGDTIVFLDGNFTLGNPLPLPRTGTPSC